MSEKKAESDHLFRKPTETNIRSTPCRQDFSAQKIESMFEFEIEKYQKEINAKKKELLREVILDSLWGLKIAQPIPGCSKRIKLSTMKGFDKKTIGKLLGKQGNNQCHFLDISKVEFKFDPENPEHVVLTKYNLIDIEKSYLFLQKLLSKDGWDYERMKKTYAQVEKQFDNKCIQLGNEILGKELLYETWDPYLAKCVGLLSYTKSFSQNMLEHSLEVGNICANIAVRLGLDQLQAKRCGFFHDIGKVSVNYSDHVQKGVEIASQVGLDSLVLNAIESHHGKIECNNPYSQLVQAADKLSAGRYLARPNQLMLIDQRKNTIRESLKKLTWIDKIVVKNAGNLLQIFLKLDGFKEEGLSNMKQELHDNLMSIREKYIHDFEVDFILVYKERFCVSNK